MTNHCALFSQIPFLLGLYMKFQLFDIALVPNYRFTRRPTMTHIILFYFYLFIFLTHIILKRTHTLSHIPILLDQLFFSIACPTS